MRRRKVAKSTEPGAEEAAQARSGDDAAQKRAYLRQSDVPGSTLDDALRLPQAIFDQYAGKPTSPFNVARALNVDPKGSQLRLLSGAAIAFGLVEGGAQASAISVTDLAKRILRPKVEGEDIGARREALLRPRVFNEFLRQYDGNQFPRRDIGLNVLEEMGVQRSKCDDVFDRIQSSADSVGFLTKIKEKIYVQLGERLVNEIAPEQRSELGALERFPV